MTLLVPFDDSTLSTAALEKAAEFGRLTDDDVLVLTVIPEDSEYALERGWLHEHEKFDPKTIAERMRERASEIAPNARFRYETVDSDEPTATATTNVVRQIRSVAIEIDASVVFVGTENAGSVVAPLSSVGGPVANDPHYDVYIVRHDG